MKMYQTMMTQPRFSYQEYEEIVQKYNKVCHVVHELSNIIKFLEHKFVELEKWQKTVNTRSTKKCKYFNRGYCKNVELCPFSHPQEVCQEHLSSGKCSDYGSCQKRHPRECRYWKKHECFHGGSCLYLHQKIPNNELDVKDPKENGEENVKDDETAVMHENREFDAMNVDNLVNCYEDDSEEEALEKQGDPTIEEIMKFYESDSWKESMENLENELNNCTAGLANGNINIVKEKPSILKPRNSGLKTTTRKKPKRN